MTDEQRIKELERKLLKVTIERNALASELDSRMVLEARMCKKTLDILLREGHSFEEVMRIYGAD